MWWSPDVLFLHDLHPLTQPVTYFNSAEHRGQDPVDPAREPIFRCVIDVLLLMPGRYRIDATICIDDVLQDQVEAVEFLEVKQSLVGGWAAPARRSPVPQ